MKRVTVALSILTMALIVTSNAFAFTWYWGDTIQENPVDYTYTADPSEYIVNLPIVLQLDENEFVEVVGGGLDFVLDGTRDGYMDTWSLDITNQSSIFNAVTFTEDTIFSGDAAFYRIRGRLDNFNTMPEGLFTDRNTLLNVHLMDPATGVLEVRTSPTYIDPETGELYTWNPTTSVYASNACSITVTSENTYEPGENPVPEPATMLLFGIGLLGLAGVSRRKK